MKKKEIIIVTTALTNDGAERVLSELSSEWVRLGHSVKIIQIGKNPEKCSYNISKNIEIINIYTEKKSRISWYFQQVKTLVHIMKRNPNATFLSFLSRSTYLLAVCSLFTKNRIVFSERNDPTKWPNGAFRKKMRNIAFCLADYCVYQTDEAMNYFPKKAQRHGTVIKNPCNPNLPERYTGEKRKTIITACRLHNQKNIPMLFYAFKKLYSEFPNYQLQICGQGPDEAMLKQLSKQLGIANNVIFSGFVKNIHDEMKKSTMYVCSSDYEGISNSMIEALGLGLPTVSTDCPIGGAREMITSEVNGLLVPVGDAEAMYVAMKKIITEPEFAAQISNSAYRVREEYQISRIAKKWLEIF